MKAVSSRMGTTPVAAARSGRIGDIAAFLVPAMIFLHVQVVGRLFLSELALAGALPLLVRARAGRPWSKPARTFVGLGTMWLLALILADLVRASHFTDFARGWSKVVFTIVNFAALYLLLGNSKRRMTLYAAGLVVGGLLSFRLAPNAFAGAYPWKFGVGFPLTLAMVLVVTLPAVKRVPLLPMVLMLSMALTNMTQGYRSAGGFCIVTAVYALVQQVRRPTGPSPLAPSPLQAAALLVMGAAAVVTILQLYSFGATRGTFGPSERLKFQQESGDFGVVIGGRSDSYFASRAIARSPIVGHGSWAKGATDDAAVAALRRHGYRYVRGSAKADDLIPSHSYLLGAWVEAGVLGAVFWLSVLALAFRVMMRLHHLRHPLGPLVAFVAASLLWDMMFSPYGAEARLTAPYFVVLLIFALDHMGAPGDDARNSSLESPARLAADSGR